MVFFKRNIAELKDPQDVATKAYVDSNKPIITVFAEEKGPTGDGNYEFSFGNGNAGNKPRARGLLYVCIRTNYKSWLISCWREGKP